MIEKYILELKGLNYKQLLKSSYILKKNIKKFYPNEGKVCAKRWETESPFLFNWILKRNKKKSQKINWAFLGEKGKKSLLTVLRSPFVFKKSREQFFKTVYKGRLYLENLKGNRDHNFIKVNEINKNKFILKKLNYIYPLACATGGRRREKGVLSSDMGFLKKTIFDTLAREAQGGNRTLAREAYITYYSRGIFDGALRFAGYLAPKRKDSLRWNLPGEKISELRSPWGAKGSLRQDITSRVSPLKRIMKGNKISSYSNRRLITLAQKGVVMKGIRNRKERDGGRGPQQRRVSPSFDEWPEATKESPKRRRHLDLNQIIGLLPNGIQLKIKKSIIRFSYCN